MRYLKILFLCVILLITKVLPVFAQGELIVLHQVIGDTIDKHEQQEFLLFSDILDENFTSATIHFEDSKYTLCIKSDSGLKIAAIKKEDIVENSEHVDKLTRYFKSLVEMKDSLDIDLKAPANWPNFHSEVLNDAQRRKIAIEARTYFQLNQDAEELGLLGIDKENYIKVNSKSFFAEILFEILK